MVKRRKRKSVPKDKKSRVPKKYLSGATGARRTELASIIKRRIALGKKKRGTRKKN